MITIYTLKSLSGAEEYVKITDTLGKERIHFIKGELQFLKDAPIIFEISDAGGIEIPDLIYHNGIWIVSNELKETFDSNLINYVCYKPAVLQSKKLGIKENCWIIIPPKIDCVDIDKSILDARWNFDFGLIPMLNAEKIVILSENIGYYELFMVFGIMDNNIYITDRIREVLVGKEFEGIETIKI